MAVLAYPGRDLDEHLEQLAKWGKELDPDVIIYQWYVNDMDLDGSTRVPPYDWIWRIDRIHARLAPYSYLYFLTEYSLSLLLDPFTGAPSYTERLASHFAADGEPWRNASLALAEWAALAKGLTPRVLVAIYPELTIDPGEPLRMEAGMEELQSRFEALCQREQVAVVDLGDSIRRFEDSRQLKATAFDGHPSAAAHRAMAEAVQAALEQNWPDVFGQPH
jgi:hypothetical protein